MDVIRDDAPGQDPSIVVLGGALEEREVLRAFGVAVEQV